MGSFFLWKTSISIALPISPEHAEARELALAKKWSEAVVVFRGLLKRSPRASGVAVELADVLMQAHRREEALAVLQNYLEPDESLEPAIRKKAKSPGTGSYQEQLRAKIQILSAVFFTQSSFQLYQDALVFIQQQKWKLAVEKLLKVQDLEPDNTLGLVRLGQSYIELNDYDSATEKLRFAKKLNPTHPDILTWLGRALFYKGELDAAQVELEAAHRMDPANERAVLWLFELINSKSIQNQTQNQGKLSTPNRFDSPEAVALVEKFVAEYPYQMSARLISFRNRILKADGNRAQLHSLRNEMIKGDALLNTYFQAKPSALSPWAEARSPYYLEHRPSMEQLRSELQLLVKDVELKISRMEKRGV